MAGLVPAIPAGHKNVDARDEPGHDDESGMRNRLRLRQGFGATSYFGRTVGSPPGLPGGGMTGMAPFVLGAGACISGSTPEGGQSTPSDFANLSPSGSRDWPVVVPSAERFGRSCGVQLVACCGDGGAVACGGVAGAGGACAIALPEAAIRRLARMMFDVVRMGGKRAGQPACSAPPITI
jgi:hypothetical protein